jgi:hypothetical protein
VLNTAYDPGYLDNLLPPLEPERKERGQEHHGEDQEPPVRLDDYGMQGWRGEIVKHTDSGEVDRSRSLLLIGRFLYEGGATRETLVAALKERDVSLEWNKYEAREYDKEYHEIVNELEAKGLNNVHSLDSRRTGLPSRKSSFKDCIRCTRPWRTVWKNLKNSCKGFC